MKDAAQNKDRHEPNKEVVNTNGLKHAVKSIRFKIRNLKQENGNEEEVKPTSCQEAIVGVVPFDIEILKCDYYCWAPQCLQPYRTRRCVLFWKCWGLFLQSQFVSAFVPSGLSSIERQFNLNSKGSGAVACLFDVGVILLLLPISFWGNNTRRLRLESIGYLIMAGACFLFILPQILVGGSRYFDSGKTSSSHLCTNTTETALQCKTDSSRGNYVYIFALANLLFGVGSSPILTTGTAYIDDNTNTKQGPVYLGIYMSMMLLGAASGYVVNSVFLKFYVDLGNNPDGVQSTDIDRWIGAWWAGPFFTIPMLCLAAFALFGFPKRLPGSIEWSKRVDESFGRSNTTMSNIVGQNFQAFYRSLLLMLKNRTLMCLVLSAVCELFFITGITTFGTKVIQSRFFLQASQATFYSGITAVFIGAAGFIVGGVIHGYGKLTASTSMRMIACISIFCVPTLGALLIPCSSKGKLDWKEMYNVNCSLHCDCSSLPYLPGCGADGLNYISPCHAGCTEYGNGTYQKCSCISSNRVTDQFQWTNGRCAMSCNNLFIYIILVSVETFLTFVMACPALNTAIRIVPRRQKSMALGFVSLLSRILGSIPSPILVGFAFDSACLVSVGKACGEEGTCTIYDQKKLGMNLLLVFGTVKSVSTLALFMAFFSYKPPLHPPGAQLSDEDSNSLKESAFPQSPPPEIGAIIEPSSSLSHKEGQVHQRESMEEIP